MDPWRAITVIDISKQHRLIRLHHTFIASFIFTLLGIFFTAFYLVWFGFVFGVMNTCDKEIMGSFGNEDRLGTWMRNFIMVIYLIFKYMPFNFCQLIQRGLWDTLRNSNIFKTKLNLLQNYFWVLFVGNWKKYLHFMSAKCKCINGNDVFNLTWNISVCKIM